MVGLEVIGAGFCRFFSSERGGRMRKLKSISQFVMHIFPVILLIYIGTTSVISNFIFKQIIRNMSTKIQSISSVTVS